MFSCLSHLGVAKSILASIISTNHNLPKRIGVRCVKEIKMLVLIHHNEL